MGCHGSLMGHVPTRQSRRNRQSKGSKIGEAPRICTAAPTTANRPAPSPAAPANRKPDVHRAAAAADVGRPGRSSKACPVISDAMAVGTRTAFGRTVTTVATFTCISNGAPSWATSSKIYSSGPSWVDS